MLDLKAKKIDNANIAIAAATEIIVIGIVEKVSLNILEQWFQVAIYHIASGGTRNRGLNLE